MEQACRYEPNSSFPDPKSILLANFYSNFLFTKPIHLLSSDTYIRTQASSYSILWHSEYIYMPDVPRYRVKTCLVFMNNEPPLLRAVEIDFISRTAGKDVQSRAQKPFVGIRLSSWRVPSQRKDYVDTAFGVSGGQTCRETFGQTRTISCFAISTRTQRWSEMRLRYQAARTRIALASQRQREK